MGKCNLAFGESGPQEPNDYLDIHFEGFMEVHEDKMHIVCEDPWEYELYAEIAFDEKPKVWITDELYISFDISGHFYVNNKSSKLYVIADLYSGDLVDEEFANMKQIFNDHWVTKEEIKNIIEIFAGGVKSKIINNLKTTKVEWDPPGILELNTS